MCCFHRDVRCDCFEFQRLDCLLQGPVWMMKGMGNKSRKKSKGFKKISKNNISSLMP